MGEMLITLALSAVCIVPPVNGPMVAGYSPAGAFAGHWGADYAADDGSVVRAATTGKVTFAGSVAGMRTVTIEPVPGVKVSTSYLASVSVKSGAWVSRGSPIGTSGLDHGGALVHLSVRIGGKYVDPRGFLGCRQTDISRALRLVTPPGPYPRRRAHRHPGRDLRPHPHWSPPRRRGRLGSTQP